ncbi:type II secretion system F family protein [Sphingobium vermicomposti]|uniref:Tight adherence protein B n=1 Tax=Sphingobium vermicomposti TaxID=529005 RepID=A0A846MBW1_9SPHN|nr:type II secretion system F family protein [Sphingobium vermicomposti]NIJ18110.1 tight adherence protein B [Sphingobium vermicomposti]
MLRGAAFLLLALLIMAAVLGHWLALRGAARSRLNRRLAALSQGVDAPPIRLSAPLTVPDRIAPLLAQAQLEITPRTAGIIAGGLMLLALVLLLVSGPVAVLGLLLAVPLLSFGWVKRRAQRRIDALIDALPFYIDAVRQMQTVGNSLSQALERSLGEAPGIVRAYLAPVARRLELGAPVGEAMQQLADRLRVPEVSMLAAAIRTNLRYGGSITGVLSNLAAILRERIRIKRELKAATSEAKVSSRVLIAMPLVAMALLMSMNPAYIDFFLADPRGRKLAVVAIGLQAAGMLVMRRVMRLAF